ncbi:MAG TPA: PAS domain S-box protein [Gemmatimonadaceae bacterium]|nr:PAS domain S-box protein [Gemmatimonadaceae bacterium]
MRVPGLDFVRYLLSRKRRERTHEQALGALEQHNALLEEQAIELEEQRENAEAIAAELEERNAELKAALAEAEEARAAAHALIAELRRTQDELDERERRFRRVVESDMIGIVFWDSTGEISDANEAFLQIVGYTREDLRQGRVAWRRMTPPEWLPVDEHALAEIAERGTCAPFEKEYVRKDGTRVRVLIGASSLDGVHDRGVAFVLDVSDRWAWHMALRTSEARYRLLFEANPLPMWVFDRETLRFLAVNRAAIEQYGYTREEFLQRTIRDIRPPEDIPLLESLLGDRPEPRRAAAVRHQRKDGTIIDVEITADSLELEGRPGRLVLAHNVTERRRAVAELERAHAALAASNAELHLAVAAAERAREMAQAANEAKSTFLALMSHELRTPLNAIVGYGELLEIEICGPVTADQRDKLVRMRRAANHLMMQINQVLDFERAVAGRSDLLIEQADVGDFVRETLMDVEPQAAAKGLALSIDLPSEPVIIRTDVAKLRQIIVNLLSNAVKYTDHGEVVARVRRTNGDVELSVRDTGMGIRPEHQRQIFDPFWQADQRLTRDRGGTGLGLSIVRQFTDLLGGELSVESAPGQGSTFTVRLPLTPPQRAAAA